MADKESPNHDAQWEEDAPVDPTTGSEGADRLLDYPALAGKLRRLLEHVEKQKALEQEPSPDSRARERVLGDYRIIRRIGAGGMATVYEAEQISLRRRVALKILAAHLSFSDRAVQKFRREAEAASMQSHPGVVTVHTLGEEQGIYFIASELVEGGRTLADLLDEQRELKEHPRGYFREVAELIARVADALQHVHDSGVIHRDVKPQNILLAEEDRPRITDFGLARVEDALALSRTGDFLGTPYYMSPEQVLGRRSRIDHRTDIFSLGVTLYECLTLERPFEGETPQEVLGEIIQNEPRAPIGIGSRVPMDLRVICLKALEKDLRHRYQTMDELAEDLRRFLAGEAIVARPTGYARRSLKFVRRHRALVLSAAAALAAIVTVGVMALQLHSQRLQERAEAMGRFRPWREVLGGSESRRIEALAGIVRASAPGSPCASMYECLHDIDRYTSNWYGGTFVMGDTQRLLSATGNLLECIASSEDGSMGALDLTTESRYLLSLVCLARMEAASSPSARSLLRAEAADWMTRAGEFDPTSGDALFLRELDRPEVPEGGMLKVLAGLRLNEDHALVHQYHGQLLFQRLYQGGTVDEFLEAIRRFQLVLEVRTDNVPALASLGRVYYFFARTYEFLEYLEDARDCVERAIENAGDRPYFLNFVTLGQIDYLIGDNRRARHRFEEAIETAGVRRVRDLHNAYRGLGQVDAREGRFDEARVRYAEAGGRSPLDAHLCVALAELELSLDRPVEALKHAERGVGHRGGMSFPGRSEQSTLYLALARCHLRQGREQEALDSLRDLQQSTRQYPRIWSLTCLLLPTFSGEPLAGQPAIEDLALALARQANLDATFAGRSSPICRSARGAAEYLNGRYREAVDEFHAALRARDRWPSEIRSCYWAEDARDRYYLAMAHAGLAREASGEEADLAEAMTFYREAEAAFEAGRLTPENRDLLLRVRRKAERVLGIAD